MNIKKTNSIPDYSKKKYHIFRHGVEGFFFFFWWCRSRRNEMALYEDMIR